MNIKIKSMPNPPKKVCIIFQPDPGRKDIFHRRGIKPYANFLGRLKAGLQQHDIEVVRPDLQISKLLPHVAYDEKSFCSPNIAANVVASGDSENLISGPLYINHVTFHNAYLQNIIKQGILPIFISSYHEDSLPFYAAIKAQAGFDPWALIFDAHTDAACPLFASSGFINYGIYQKILVPQKTMLFTGNFNGWDISPRIYLTDIAELVEITLGLSFFPREQNGALEQFIYKKLGKKLESSLFFSWRSIDKYCLEIAEIIWLKIKGLHFNFAGEEVVFPEEEPQGVISFDADLSSCQAKTILNTGLLNDYKNAMRKFGIWGIHICELDNDMNAFSSQALTDWILGILNIN